MFDFLSYLFGIPAKNILTEKLNLVLTDFLIRSDYEDEEEIEVGITTTINPIKSVNRVKSRPKKFDVSIPTCQMQIAETLPASVFEEKDLAPNHLPMHEV